MGDLRLTLSRNSILSTKFKRQNSSTVLNKLTIVFLFLMMRAGSPFLAQELEICGKITSVEDRTALVEIGYGEVKKADATGSVIVISVKDFNLGRITSPQELIIGKAAGVVVNSLDGAAGAGTKIRIRGGSSLQANNDPLIVIDNISLESAGISGMANPLTTINPNDIESITILKDASATAIYGSRASNGVIIIKTKKGPSAVEKDCSCLRTK